MGNMITHRQSPDKVLHGEYLLDREDMAGLITIGG